MPQVYLKGLSSNWPKYTKNFHTTCMVRVVIGAFLKMSLQQHKKRRLQAAAAAASSRKTIVSSSSSSGSV
jgi:hypothetical protein